MPVRFTLFPGNVKNIWQGEHSLQDLILVLYSPASHVHGYRSLPSFGVNRNGSVLHHDRVVPENPATLALDIICGCHISRHGDLAVFDLRDAVTEGVESHKHHQPENSRDNGRNIETAPGDDPYSGHEPDARRRGEPPNEVVGPHARACSQKADPVTTPAAMRPGSIRNTDSAPLSAKASWNS